MQIILESYYSPIVTKSVASEYLYVENACQYLFEKVLENSAIIYKPCQIATALSFEF